MECAAGRVEGAVRLLRAVMNQWAAVGIDHVAEEPFHRGFLTVGSFSSRMMFPPTVQR